MKAKIIKMIINTAHKIDLKNGNLRTYDYETAPYCGHHYNGATGKYYFSDYFEGYGAEWANFYGFIFIYANEDKEYICRYKFPYKLELRLFWNGDKILSCSIFDLKRVGNFIKIWWLLFRIKRQALQINLKIDKL